MNLNGMIEFVEFVLLMGLELVKVVVYSDKELFIVFWVFDWDGNGFIIVVEFVYLMVKFG